MKYCTLKLFKASAFLKFIKIFTLVISTNYITVWIFQAFNTVTDDLCYAVSMQYQLGFLSTVIIITV